MITASKVKERIQTLIDIANEKTEKNDVDLTSAVNSLIEGGGSGGGDASQLDALIDGSLTELTSNVTDAKSYTFRDSVSLTKVSLPYAKNIGDGLFFGCKSLVSVEIPSAQLLRIYSFKGCEKLEDISLPSASSLADYSFEYCFLLSKVDTDKLNTINKEAFSGCYSLKALILRQNSMCKLSNTTGFKNCYHILGTTNATYNPNGDKDGYIYVPRALIEDYKVATNWTTYASQFRVLEDYTVDGTITGELDETKIAA